MSAIKHHHADHDAMVHEHNQFTDTVGDAVIRLQDEAYELGRARGKQEANAELIDALKAVPAVEHALPFGNKCDCTQCQFVRVRADAIRKAATPDSQP
jgi:hypothetical protein